MVKKTILVYKEERSVFGSRAPGSALSTIAQLLQNCTQNILSAQE